MIHADPRYSEISHVCSNMRDASAEEMFACRPHDSPSNLADELYDRGGLKWVGYYKDEPAAMIGAMPLYPGVWGLFGFGTDNWQKIWRPMTVFARKTMMPAVKSSGAHRAHCASPVGHDETHKWLRFLGAEQEAVLRGYGKNGEDFALFAWTKEKSDVRIT